MKKIYFLEQYKFSLLLFLIVIIFSKFFFNTEFDIKSDIINGQIKGSETVANDFFTNNKQSPMDNKVVAFQSAISTINHKSIQPTQDPLYTISGNYIDVNQDNHKEWVIIENWQGASGWSEKYQIYKFENLKPKKIFEKFFENSIVYFDNGKMYQIEPYYQEDLARSDVSDFLITIYGWKDQKFEISSQEIYSIDSIDQTQK